MRIASAPPWIRRSAAVSFAALLWSPAASHRAHAYGGFWSSQAAPVQPTGEQIVFVDNPDDTVTAIISVKYAGPSRKFAWVIPVPGKPTVGVSSNTALGRLDLATAPQYWVEVAVEGKCKPEGHAAAALAAGSGAIVATGAHNAPAAPVVVIDQGSAAPYDYATIKVDPTHGDPAKVAADWFASNGYPLSGIGSDLLTSYVRSGFNLLAFKLASDKDVGAIRPVVLTYQSKRLTIPIRPAAVAANGDMGILVWVIGPSQAVPDNYKSLVLNDALIDWLSGRKYVAGTLPSGGVGPFDPSYGSRPSNYDAVVRAAVREAGGQGFVTELAAPVSRYRDFVWSSTDEKQFARISTQSYADGIDAILAASAYFGSWEGWRDAVEGATTLPAVVTIDDFVRNPGRYRDVAKVDRATFVHLLGKEVVRPVADAAAMLYRAPYITRLYGSLRSDEMTVDPAFDYNAELALVSNIHVAKQFIRCRRTLLQHDASWRMDLPQGGVVAGKGSSRWPMATGSMSANLKIVQLSATGSGTVVTDNGDDIGMKLFTGSPVARHEALPRGPQNGLMIGGSQMVTTPHRPIAWTHSSPSPLGGSKCTVSQVGAGGGSALTRWLPLTAVIFARRRRRGRAAAGRERGGSHETLRRV